MSQLKRLIAEAHRRSLWQVLGIYGFGAWAVYEVVLGLYEGIGLPDWLPVTTLVLLLAFLPVVLATAFVQEGGPGARSEEAAAADGPTARRSDPAAAEPRPHAGAPPEAMPADSPAPPDLRRAAARLFTWSRALTAAVLAFAALGLGTTGFMGMRALGIGPAGTLMAKGLLDERDPILLADLESPTGDSVLSRMVQGALRIDLDQSETVRLADPGHVVYLLERMQRPADTRLTEEVAREAAVRGGMKAVLSGEVGTVGSSYILSARLVDAGSGQTLAAFRETARDSSNLVDAIDRLSARIRGKVGESLRSVRASPPLSYITSTSLTAIRTYIEGFNESNRGNEERAMDLFREAIALDPDFAMAHRKLAVELSNQGRIGDALRAVETALANPERLTEHERLHAEAFHANLIGDHARAIRAREAILAKWPTCGIALANLALSYVSTGDYERAIHWYLRGIENADSTAYRTPAVWTGFHTAATWLLAGVGQLERADSVAADLADIVPDHPDVPLLAAMLAFWRGDYDAMAAPLDSILALRPNSASWRYEHRFVEASGLTIQGRIAAADAALLDSREAATTAGMAARALESAALQAALWGGVVGDGGRARDILTAARRRLEPEIGPEEYPYELMAFASVAADRETALSLPERFRREAPEWRQRSEPATLAVLDGLAAFAAGRHSEAIELLARAYGTAGRACYLAYQGMAAELNGQPDLAAGLYTRYLEEPDPFRDGVSGVLGDPHLKPLVLERLAGLEEAAGRAEQARDHYLALVALWKDADPVLQPRVEAARRALARFVTEPPG